MTAKAYKKSTITYYVNQNSTAKDALTNGSFYRQSRLGISHFMNGDFMGFVGKIPNNVVMVSRECAEEYMPKCCR